MRSWEQREIDGQMQYELREGWWFFFTALTLLGWLSLAGHMLVGSTPFPKGTWLEERYGNMGGLWAAKIDDGWMAKIERRLYKGTASELDKSAVKDL